MPQRQRPRLKRIPITCDWCGSTALKLYPSRESVRQQLSPYHFCSSTCQREHWEARRKRVGWPYPCRQCGATITPQQAPGRRRDYCSAACKQKAARERLRHPAGAVVGARQRFQEAWRQAVKAMNQWVGFDAHGAPVGKAYRQGELVHNTEGVTRRRWRPSYAFPKRSEAEGLNKVLPGWDCRVQKQAFPPGFSPCLLMVHFGPLPTPLRPHGGAACFSPAFGPTTPWSTNQEALSPLQVG